MTERFPPDLIKGTTELLVLSLLSSSGALHGYGILKRLRELSAERLRMNEGALYPLLHRLVREKKIATKAETVGGRERKTYRLTRTGERALVTARGVWDAYRDFVGLVIDPESQATRADGEDG